LLKPSAKLLVSAGLGVFLHAESARADCNDPFGKPNELLDFHLRLSQADWMALLNNRLPSTDGNPGACDDQYREFKAEFRCGSEGPWLKIAMRKKRGEERGVEAPLKPPLKLDINEDFMGTVPEAKGQSWPAHMGRFGFRKLTLNNGQGNRFMNRTIPLPVLMAEHVTLRLLKREVPTAPGTAYAKVTIHTENKPDGEYHGVYVLIEDIDRPALLRRFNRNDGRLVKSSKDACPVEVQFDDGPPNASRAAYDSFIAKNPAMFPGTWLAEANKGLDLDTLLRQEAIREILVNGDDTIATSVTDSREGLNFYYYEPREGLRHYMPWDVDLAFGQQNENCAPNSLKCLPTERVGRWCGGVRSRVGAATVCQTEIRKRYLEVMCQLINGSMASEEILKVWEEAYSTIKDTVPLEKDLIWGGRDPSSTAIDKSFGAEYVRLKSWIPARINSVRSQISCAPGCTAGASEACTFLTCAGQRRCENNRWTTCQPMASCALPGPTVTGGSPGSDGGVGGADASSPGDAGAAPPVPGTGGVGGGSSGGGGAGGGGAGAAGAGGGAAPGGGMAGAGGGSGPTPSAGRGGSGAPGGAAGAPGPGAPGEMPAPGGCQCRTVTGGATPASGWLLLAAPVLLAWRRRRRRSVARA
jgi:MYXO-CTERM domain-containing protein